MHHSIQWLLALTLSLFFIGSPLLAQSDSSTTPPLNPKDLSYAYGYNFAKDLAGNDNFSAKERETRFLLKGFKKALSGLDTTKLNQVIESLMARLDAGQPATETKAAREIAYNLGYNAVGNLMNLLELSPKALHYGFLKKGYTDFEKGKDPRFDEEQRLALLTQFFQENQALVQARYEKEREELAAKNLEEAEAFLKENGQKTGVETTPSGLQYQIIKAGTGESPSVGNRVKVHYTGTFIDGQTFDSSIDRGEPAVFSLSEVIKGWQEGIPMMKTGARYRFFVPPNLGYGSEPPPSIAPNAVLIFDVELLEVVSDTGLYSNRSVLSYAYGYLMYKGMKGIGLTEAEQDPAIFIEGHNAGFQGDLDRLEKAQQLVENRLQSRTPTTTPEAAKELAFALGFVSSAMLVQELEVRLEDFDEAILNQGIQDAAAEADPVYTDQDMQDAIKGYFEPKQKAKQARQDTENASIAADNKAMAQAFLEKNKAKNGVITTESGLQYEVLQEGTGERPTLSSTVTTHYVGELLDGAVFDSSVERGEPASFQLGQVIQGWQEGLALMKEGAKYRFYIPSELAYGDQGAGGSIPPGSLLIFEVELLKVE